MQQLCIIMVLIFGGRINLLGQEKKLTASQERFKDSIDFNILPGSIIDPYTKKSYKFSEAPKLQQEIFKKGATPYKALQPEILEKIKFKNRRTLVFFHNPGCSLSDKVKKVIDTIKETPYLDIKIINQTNNPELYKSLLKASYSPAIWFIKPTGYYRQHIGESFMIYRKIDAFVKKKYPFL
jgi:hypothetical protein